MEANPRPLKPIGWRFNGRPISASPSSSQVQVQLASVGLQPVESVNQNLADKPQSSQAESSPQGGAIVNNLSLVLRKVSRQQAGLYTCEASNSHGANTSRPLRLTVRHAPICQSDEM